MNGIMVKSFVSLAAVLALMLSALAMPTSASVQAVDVSDEIPIETGATDMIGGDDHFFVRFGTDAASGIVWGADNTERIKTSLPFRIDWTGIGGLTWVDDVTVDGEPEIEMVQIAEAYLTASTDTVAGHSMNFADFTVPDGLMFAGGELIVHDPIFTSDALVYVSEGGATGLPLTLIGLAVATFAIIIAAALFAVFYNNKPRKGDNK